jgi:hypothetical protein
MTTIWWHREPTLEDILSDSITKAVMAADGVDPQELTAALKVVSRSPLRPALAWGPWSAVTQIKR